MKIPSGYSVITEGLSLKYNEVDKYTILDSAGLQTPLLSDEKYEDKDEEKNKKNMKIYIRIKLRQKILFKI